ncbi:MAG: endolytic transglycosylase MltG [Pseudohongiella sp.]
MRPARLRKFVAGETLQYRLTLVEGWTFDQALNEIWLSEKVNIELTGLSKSEISVSLNLETENPEGMFFPDTYFYTAGTSDREILLRAKENLENILADAWGNRLGALPLESSYEALILASIIEKESSVESERGHISGVFVRRLEQGMRLQSDPTVIYGLGPDFDGSIKSKDLRNETAYNTYRIKGLPPTPIALAGIESIEASVNPLPSNYLYFVATGDGGHKFSSSLEEHNAAVNEYQR